MFTPLPGHNHLPIAPQQVVAVIESINTPNISIPELGTEPTKAFLVGCLRPSGGACVFCYLLMVDTNRPILYVSNPAEVSLEQYQVLEGDAIQFVESMGFMLDNMNIRARPPHEQAAMVDALPFFREQQPRMAGTTRVSAASMAIGADAIPPERQALARFLASF